MSFRYPSGIIKPGFDPLDEPATITVYDRLYSWGNQENGRLGEPPGNYNYKRSSPLQVGALTTWSENTSGYGHNLAIKSDGTLWAWGKNNNGQLGLGNTTNYSSPKQIGALTTWSKIAAGPGGGSDFSLAIKTDGTMWSWGSNYFGGLGLGNVADRSSPVQVGALTDWSKIAAGNLHTIAVKTDGTLWSWGRNSDGQLGDGTTTYRSSPVQVGALTTWSKIESGEGHNLAIKTDGTLWSWGKNSYGQLGDGDVGYGNHKSSPVQIGALTTWDKMSCGSTFSLAIKTNNTLWSWGQNNNGKLGDGTTTYRSSPVQVGALTTWSKIESGEGHNLAIKTDGTLWSWGLNSDGQLGDGTTTYRSSPVQVGGETTWDKISPGFYHSIAISW